ncbi:hypothetical protein ACIBJE_07335 [Micromonospora sp. NPDC050187]|uniref:hypothetical protein n=1 Tax=Micromonospora sp. NPDC050187 TaxID=3364277 RepID=UPI00378A3125
MPARAKAPAGIAALATTMVLLLSACAHPTDAGGQPKYQDFAGYSDEYRKATERLDLPARSTWPELMPSPEDNARYAIGVGTTKAELAWLCEWEKEWLEHSSNPRKAATILNEIKRIESFQVFTVAMDDISRDEVRANIKRAERGDQSGIQRDVQANC